MTAALTPQLALAYLDELTVDVRAAVVVGSDGAVLAGDAALADRIDDGTLLVAHAPGGAAIAVLAGDLAVLSLLAGDLGRIAEALVVPDSPS